jgi:hypothetical protein
VPGVPSSLTPNADRLLQSLHEAGHTVSWGLAGDRRTTFYWARVTPHRTATVRNVVAGDPQTLIEKVRQAASLDPDQQLVASLADPLRTCSVCNAELSFDEDSPTPFRCPLGDGHDVVRAL